MSSAHKSIFKTLFSEENYARSEENDEYDEEEEFFAEASCGYSQRINDSPFQAKVRRGSRYSMLFGILFAAACVPVFLKLDGLSDKLNRTGALSAGIVAALLVFGLGCFYHIRYIKRRSFEGEIVSKNEKWTEKYLWENGKLKKKKVHLYLLGTKEADGTYHEVSYIDRPDIFQYFKVGDKIKKHGVLKIYEKLDKSADNEIFCSICLKSNTTDYDFCSGCKFPLLK